MDTVYKAVKVCGPNLFISWLYYMIGGSSGYGLEYAIGKTTVPSLPGSAIYAFRYYQSVLDFVKTNLPLGIHIAILECEYKPHSLKKAVRSTSIYAANIRDFWLRGMYDYDFCPDRVSPAPRGTVLCEWVKPIKVVKTV